MAVIIAALLIVVGAWFAVTKLSSSKAPAIDSSKYQAVFFVNNSVYFGKLSSSGDYLILKDVFYVKAKSEDGATGAQGASSDQGNVEITKLGDGEIHGPEDEMIIPRDQVWFYENLKSDSKVTQVIKTYKK